jgi:hypothetical protein
MLRDKENPPSAALYEQAIKFLRDNKIEADKAKKTGGYSLPSTSSAVGDPFGLPFGGPEEDEDAPTSH